MLDQKIAYRKLSQADDQWLIEIKGIFNQEALSAAALNFNNDTQSQYTLYPILQGNLQDASGDHDSWYHLFAGRFNSKEAANAVCDSISNQNRCRVHSSADLADAIKKSKPLVEQNNTLNKVKTLKVAKKIALFETTELEKDKNSTEQDNNAPIPQEPSTPVIVASSETNTKLKGFRLLLMSSISVKEIDQIQSDWLSHNYGVYAEPSEKSNNLYDIYLYKLYATADQALLGAAKIKQQKDITPIMLPYYERP